MILQAEKSTKCKIMEETTLEKMRNKHKKTKSGRVKN